MKKVTGLGGVFFKCDNPKGMNEWYAKNLGLATSDWGATFDWRQADDPTKIESTACGVPFRRIPNISILQTSHL